jgi:hypothetical protein
MLSALPSNSDIPLNSALRIFAKLGSEFPFDRLAGAASGNVAARPWQK